MSDQNKQPVCVWFREDLRLADNPALHEAHESGHPVIGVFIEDYGADYQYDGRWKPGAASRVWLHHSLTALVGDFNKKGGTFLIRTGDALDVLQKLHEETGFTALYWNRRYAPMAIARDERVKTHFKKLRIDVQSFKGAVLFEPWDIATQGGQPYKVFTPFAKACMAQVPAIGKALPAPDRLESYQHSIPKGAVDDLRLLPATRWDNKFAEHWQPGENGATARLRAFVREALAHYDTGRDRPDKDGTSRLSPHLRWGEISPRAAWLAVEGHTGKGPETYLRELIWREFATHLLYHFPDMPDEPLQKNFADMPWEYDADALQAWQTGHTGIPIVDAGMRQLWETGWMHNRVRMIVASFLTKHLLQPWQKGEEWFWDCLVDADLANNAVNWQWVAGCGADAAPYYRVFNPLLQGEKFDPAGDYVRKFVPELAHMPAKYIHQPWMAPVPPKNYPAPIIDLKEGRERALKAFEKIKKRKEA